MSDPHGQQRVFALFATLIILTTIALAVKPLPARSAGVITEFALPTPARFPTGIAAGPDGNLWFTEYSTNKIGRITPAGVIAEFDVLPVVPFTYLKDITAGPDGNLWFSDTGNSRIGRITPTGVTTMFPVPTAPSSPEGIAAGPDGNLWFTEYSTNKIGRITPAGAITEFDLPLSSNLGPEGITAGPDGNLWFAHSGNAQIGRITPAGVITLFAVPTAVSTPRDISAGPDGNLWFTERNAGKIGRITPAGAITEFNLPNSISSPYEITAGPDGNIWFAQNNADRIGRITTSGVITEFAVPTTTSSPWGIAAGPDGNIWFTEYQSNQIGRLVLSLIPTSTPTGSPPGTLTSTPTLIPGRPTLTPSPTPAGTGTPTPTFPPSPTPTVPPTPVPPRPPRPKPRPAFVTVVQRPAPNIGARRSGIITCTIVATNRGKGGAQNTTITLPFDMAKVKVLDARFSRPSAWASALLTDSLVIQTGPLGRNGDVVTATVRLLVLSSAADGAPLGTRLIYTWDDHRRGGAGRGNLPIVIHSSSDISQPLYPLAVQATVGDMLIASSPIFAPGEPVAFWYNTPAGAVEAIGRVAADDGGMVSLAFRTAGRARGDYSIVAYGLWTQFTAVGMFRIR